MDLNGDDASTKMDPYFDKVISARQQSVLNEMCKDLLDDDLKYLNEHKEVNIVELYTCSVVPKRLNNWNLRYFWIFINDLF